MRNSVGVVQRNENLADEDQKWEKYARYAVFGLVVMAVIICYIKA